MKNKLQKIKLLVVNYSVFLTLLITFELVGQLGYRILKGRFLYDRHPLLVFKEHPYLSGVPKENFRYVNTKGIDSHY